MCGNKRFNTHELVTKVFPTSVSFDVFALVLSHLTKTFLLKLTTSKLQVDVYKHRHFSQIEPLDPMRSGRIDYLLDFIATFIMIYV